VIELKSSNIPTFVKGFQRHILLAGVVFLSSSSVLLLSGCSSAFTGGHSQPLGAVEVSGITGVVHGGQQAVTTSAVQIYEVSAAGAGYGAAAMPVTVDGTTTGTVVSTSTDTSGNWTYPTYTCASTSDELYVVSSGGNPGISAGTDNTSLALAAALGPCSNIKNVGFVVINEVTTVATAYSLAGFMSDYLHVATSSTNTVGLTNAFATFNNLVNLNTGNALTVTSAYATPPANAPPDTFRSIVPYDTINTLADVLASCVNTDGGSTVGQGGTAGACASLFAITGNKTDETTLDAALYIAHNPGLPNGGQNKISALYNLVNAQAPFQPTLGEAPNDFTLTLNFTGGGLGGVNSHSRSGASTMAIDQSGNVWIPNGDRVSVTELNNLGAPLSPTTTITDVGPSYLPIALGGWGATYSGLLSVPNQIAIDQNGNAWVADASNCLVGFESTGTPLSTTPYTGVCDGKTGTTGVAVDSNNQIWIEAGQFISSATVSGSTVTRVSGFPVTSGFDALDGFLGPDYLGNVWYVDSGNGHFGALTNTGGAYTSSSQADLSGPSGPAAFGAGNILWIPQGLAGTNNIQPVNATLASINTIPTAYLPSSESTPSGIAADGKSYFYMTNQAGALNSGCSVESPDNLTVLKSTGSLVSPSCFGYVGGSALTSLSSPSAVAVDQSGNVWVVNEDNGNPAASGQLGNGSDDSNVTEFVGLATPVNPVLSLDAKNGSYGAKP
jgi:hypothetical protein